MSRLIEFKRLLERICKRKRGLALPAEGMNPIKRNTL
jgi:hypothetical protein